MMEKDRLNYLMSKHNFRAILRLWRTYGDLVGAPNINFVDIVSKKKLDQFAKQFAPAFRTNVTIEALSQPQPMKLYKLECHPRRRSFSDHRNVSFLNNYGSSAFDFEIFAQDIDLRKFYSVQPVYSFDPEENLGTDWRYMYVRPIILRSGTVE